ncbi:MAG: polysaccharide biosynthesis C-terminal domain-containing protein, partial [Pseudomonadota bacterium]
FVFSLFRQGIPVGLLMVIVVFYSRLAIFFLERFSGLEAVGQYFIAIRICEPLLAVASALSTSAFPVLSRLAEKKDANTLKRLFQKYSIRSLLLSAGVALLLTIFANRLLYLIKPDYVAATDALIALCWASVFMFQNQISSTVINSFGKYHYVTIFAAVNLCVFLTLSLNLIPSMGPTGAGLSTLGTEGINTIMQLITVSVMLSNVGKKTTHK